MAIRLKDIAAECGVSLVTVSKVLRNKPDVSQATRMRVQRRAAELGYRPNMMARGLASGRSFTIGLIIPDLVDSFFAELARSLGSKLRRQSYQLIVASADEDPAVEREEIQSLTSRGVDALLLASCQGHDHQPLGSFGIPLLLVDRRLQGVQAPFVGTDDICAGRIATEHLLALERKRIAHITAGDVSTAQERHEGYRRALAAAGIEYRKRYVVPVDMQSERADHLGHRAMETLLRSGRRPDAVFCYNDLLAVGAVRCALANGLKVPQDLAVIGCGNQPLSSYLEVPLSSVDQGTATLGNYAGNLALSLIEGKPVPDISQVQPTLIARASTIGASAPTSRA